MDNPTITPNETIDPTGEKDSWSHPRQVEDKIFPSRSDAAYLHFADLNRFLKEQGSAAPLTILDYGAGASPYKIYFPSSDYRRADITGLPDLRYKINPDSTIPEADATFDLILSTQVAEHVGNPDVYFKECFRLLKEGGRLILTTHGIWEEHGSPFDFQRWTGRGIRRDLSNAGFERMNLYQLTCGFRAATLLFTMVFFSTPAPSSLIARFFFKSIRTIYSKLFPFLYFLCDRHFSDLAIMPVKDANPHPFYIGIAAIATKAGKPEPSQAS